jgi:hypothetical protein
MFFGKNGKTTLHHQKEGSATLTFTARLAQSALAAASALVMVWSTPALAHGFGDAHLGHRMHAETIQALTASTVVVRHQDGMEQQVPTAQVAVRAGLYPATKSILSVGETVTLIPNDGSPVLVVHPATVGTLNQKNTQWQVTSRRKGTLVMAPGHPTLLGMTQLAAGQRAAVFGTVENGTLHATAVAAKPLMAEATVKEVKAGKVRLETPQYGSLTYSLDALPGRFRQHLSQLSGGLTVVACLDPVSHQVLMIWPSHTTQMAQALERGSAGQVVAVNGKDLTLTNQLGTVTIPVRTPNVQLQWSGHPKSTIQQIPPGTRIIAFRADDAGLKIMVLGQR